MHKAVRKVLQHVQPTPRCGALDDDKKALVIVLVGQGASRREAAQLVKCHHTTIGRTAARDPAFAAKLEQVESAAHLEAGDMIRRAASDPKYWRAAAWMLERRNPEDYAKRDPTTFTGDQVTSLLASFANGARAMMLPEKAAEFEQLVEDVLDEIETKSGPVKREEASKEAEKENNPLSQHEPSSNGHHATNGAAEVAPASSNGKAHAEHGEGNGTAKAASDPHPNPLPEGEGTFGSRPGPLPEGEGDDGEFDLERRREELYAEIAAHLGGYAVAPPSPNARDVLREYHRRFTHHPHHQVAARLSRDALRKVFTVNDLHQQSTTCTTAPNTEGRCTNGAVSPNGKAVVDAE
jgi:hypothetical protein